MAECLLCHRNSRQQLTLWQLLNFQPVEPPLLCQTCLGSLEAISPEQACSGCGRAWSEQLCPDCAKWQELPSFKNRAMYQYNELLKQYMSQYKFYGDYRLRKVFQAEIVHEINQFKADLVVPIPIDMATQQRRGFNQVAGLLEPVKIVDGLMTLESDKQRPQSAKNRQERLKSKQPFKLNLSAEKFNKKKVLVVDDIYTTGRTIRHAATLLLDAGASEVVGLTLAHG